MLQVIGREDLLGDPRFTDNKDRFANRDALDAVIGPWCAERSKVEVMQTLGQAGVPAGAVFDTDELYNDPFLRKRGMFATVEHAQRGEVTMPAWPVKMSDSQVPLCAAPLLGQDNVQVYGELGLTPEQIDALRAEQAI